MVLPKLIHPIPCKIQQIDTAKTRLDPDTREPIQRVVRNATVTVNGQPKWFGHQEGEQHRYGASEGSDGYVLFRYVDLAAAGVTLKRNDRIIQIGTIDTDVYIEKLQPTGHYPDQGGPSLVKAHFADRQPSRQTRGG